METNTEAEKVTTPVDADVVLCRTGSTPVGGRREEGATIRFRSEGTDSPEIEKESEKTEGKGSKTP